MKLKKISQYKISRYLKKYADCIKPYPVPGSCEMPVPYGDIDKALSTIYLDDAQLESVKLKIEALVELLDSRLSASSEESILKSLFDLLGYTYHPSCDKD